MSESNLAQGNLKSSIKSGFRFSVWGACILGLGLSLLVPKIMVWYFEPPINPGCSCASAIEWALRMNARIQGIGLGLGALLGFGVGWRWSRKKI